MSLDIVAAIRGGVQRGLKRNGVLLMAIFVVLSILSSIFAADFFASVFSPLLESRPGSASSADFGSNNPLVGTDPTEPLLGLSGPVAGIGWILVSIGGLIANITAIRTFVSNETYRIPRKHVTRNLPWVVGNIIIGQLVFVVLLGVGFFFLVVPGLFLLVSLYFWDFVVAIEDENFLTGLRRSWGLTRGHRIRLFLLGLIVVSLSLIASLPGSFLAESGLVGMTASALLCAPVGVFTIAIGAEAFQQLRQCKL
jgi:hypothetical protein